MAAIQSCHSKLAADTIQFHYNILFSAANSFHVWCPPRQMTRQIDLSEQCPKENSSAYSTCTIISVWMNCDKDRRDKESCIFVCTFLLFV